jgi:tRNA(fMet)-specific endonuclease VapC
MSLYVLDTDTLTLFEEGHSAVLQRIGAHPAAELAITVLSVEEQLSGWYSRLRQAKDPARLALAYRRLARTIRFLSGLRILDFDESAILEYTQLQKKKLKVRKMDLRIAAVVLQHKAVLVSRNLQDFQRIPGLPLKTGRNKPRTLWLGTEPYRS